ncbi:MAG: hypothetical protein JHC87_01470, partial [Thermoleophilaceae bacterium]|nr:hypothetical protein [Thermoleophilaceae bacterium]
MILLAALLLAILGTSTALAAEVTPGELIVGFDNNTSRSESRAVVNAADASIDQRLPQIDAAVVSVDDGQSLSDAISALEQSQGVSYVEPNYS